jgi:hypothetical protein
MANILSLIILIIAVGVLLWASSKMASIKRNVLYTSNIVQEQRSQLVDLLRKQGAIIHNFNLLVKRLELITGEEQHIITQINDSELEALKQDINLLEPKITENTRLL